MGGVFKFKQFDVDQRDCAMKINTDGVLLGAILSIDLPSRILDIGSGTGVISLMLAQRFEDAYIDAVEIDEGAYLRSRENFNNSRFSNRLTIYHSSFESLEFSGLYDVIVSNPPFFTNSLHNPDPQRKLARHTDHDFFLNLLMFSYERLTNNGSLQLILPTALALEVVEMAQKLGYSLKRKIDIRSFVETESIRQIIDLTKAERSELSIEDVVIYKAKGEYTDYYKKILSPFFLAY